MDLTLTQAQTEYHGQQVRRAVATMLIGVGHGITVLLEDV
jgi:acetyl-CoA acetyltransferase